MILGTRPEIIKLSPVLRLLAKRRQDHFVIHSGQHYSYEMDAIFFKDLELKVPKYSLNVRCPSADAQALHIGRMMEKIYQVIRKERPGIVLVQGDTSTVLAGALSATKSGVRVGHIEAGLRSYDERMPEEINRRLTDHISDYLFAPTPLSKSILLGEGISKNKIHVVGNTIVDSVFQNLRLAIRRGYGSLARRYRKTGYFLMTLHRQENVDDKRVLFEILKGVANVASQYKKPVLFSAHPRTMSRIREFKLQVPKEILPLQPIGFLDFLVLESRARLILTDSGGVQEEACILKVPCVTLRTSTERPETVSVGGNVVAGVTSKSIVNATNRMMQKKVNWSNPLGDGHASEKILSILKNP